MERNKPQPIFPWYKERLQTKYPKAWWHKISSLSSFCCSADASLCHVPPLVSPPNRVPAPKPEKSKELACFSKQMMRRQMGRERVAAAEAELKRRPLTTYVHYKDHMTRELFEKVLSVLDPDVCISDSCLLPVPATDHAEEEEEEEAKRKQPESGEVRRSKPGSTATKIVSDAHNSSPSKGDVHPMTRKMHRERMKVKLDQVRRRRDV